MKIAVIGAGAMGAIYATLFAEAGHDVLVIQRAGPHLAAIRTHGLRLSGFSGDRTIAVRAVEVAPDEPQDLVIFAVKATQVDVAAREAGGLIGTGTIVLAMQNGIGAADILARSIDPGRIAVGIAAAFGASLAGPGHARHKGMEAIRIGAHAGLREDDLAGLAQVWREAGFKAEAVGSIAAMQWEKLICNASFSAPCGLTGLTVGAALADANIGPLCIGAGTEAWTIAKGLGIPISVADPESHIRGFAARVAGAKPSLLQDIEAGRPTEIDFINGAVPREARTAGLSAPVNETLARLVRHRETMAR
ncbi:MAG: 2-dehydropantoate 2-reductase [Sphingomonadales bacterium]|nr:2-dehydropantoate 2-reductase [Sphingomonadales bacterium]MDE2567284.1 2-dehydropantoate 2-reductase [Sphingomonadales bacterium]